MSDVTDPTESVTLPDLEMPGIGPEAAPSRQEVLSRFSVPDLDIARIRRLVDARAGRRLRRRRLLLGAATALIAVGVTFAAWPNPEPQEISADRDDQSTSTSSTTSSTTTTLPTPLTTVPVSTVTTLGTSTTAPVTTVATTVATTTVPPNKPMTVQAELLDGATMTPTTNPVAGQAVALRVRWSDPDLADPAVVDVNVVFGDPLVARPIVATPRPACDRSGGGSAAMVDVPFRFSSAGSPTIQVEVTACDGIGTYGERITRAVPVKVEPPAAGTRIVVLAGIDGGRQPDAGEVVAGSAITPKRAPELPLVLTSDATPATVAPVPAAYTGVLLLRWQPTVCQPSATPPKVDAGSTTVRVVLGPTTTTCTPSP